MTWNWVDGVIAVIIGLSILTGLFRGFVKEIMALMVWGIALWLAFNYSENVSEYLEPFIKDKTMRNGISFVSVLFGTLITGGLINALLSFILHRSGLSGTDRLLGMGFGFVRGIFIVSLVMLVVKATSLPYQTYSRQSLLYAKFEPFVIWLSQFTPALMQQAQIFDGAEEITDITPSP